MRKPLLLLATLAVVLAATIAITRPIGPDRQAEAETLPSAAPGIGEQLRYIGRDEATGMARTVNDRFIAAVERSYQLYGIQQSPAVPPPPVKGADVARLVIPAIGVNARVARYGLDGFGRLDVPQDSTTVGWNPGYTALPGTDRTTFFAAHVEFAGRPGVFNRLHTLKPDDVVTVQLSDGTSVQYRVTSTLDYVLETIDMGAILEGREGREGLTLMTCSGTPDARGFSERTLVLADRID